MELKDIKELIALMKKNDLSEFKMEKDGFKISLKKGVDFSAMPTAPTPQPMTYAPAPAVSAAAPAPDPQAAPAKDSTPTREIVSPMVGTYYSAGSPDSPPFVEVGQEVTEETVVCIIEAMKVMNEIKAEMRGTIAEVLVENGKSVQFGQALFRLK